MAEGLKFEVVIDDAKGTPVIRRLGAEVDGLGSRGRGIDALRARFEGLNASFRATMGGLQGMIAAAAAGAGMGAVVREGIRFNASIEQTSTSFRVLLGDQKKAADLMKEIVAFAAQTPFQLEEVAAAEKTLIGAGMQGVDYLRAVGDAASFANRPITEVALAFSRIKGGGFGEGFERLREMNIATREMLEAKGLKFDSGGAYKGSARDAMDAVLAIVQERFGGMTQAQAQTWSGLMSTLRDSWAMFAGRLTAPLFDKLKPKIQEAIAAFERLSSSSAVQAWAEKLAKSALDVIRALTDGVRETIAFVSEHKELVSWLLRSVAAFAGLGVAIQVVTTLLAVNPWMLLVAGIALAAGWIWKTVDALGGWSVAWEYVKAGAAAAMDYVNAYLRISWEAIQALGSNWQATGRAIWETLKAAFMTGIDSVVAFGRSAWEIVRELGQRWRDFGNLLLGVITFDRSKIASSWDGIRTGMSTALDNAQSYFSGVGRDRWAGIGQLWGNALGAEFFMRTSAIMAEVDAKAEALFAKARAASAEARARKAASESGGGAPAVEAASSTSSEVGKAAETGGASLARQILGASKDGFDSWTEYFNAWVEETLSGVWGVVSNVADIIGSTVSDLFEAAIFDAKSFGEATHEIFSNMKRAIVREIVDAAVSYALNLARMGLLRSLFEKKVTADVVANTATRIAVQSAETASTQVQTQADVQGAAAKTFKAHAWLPFVGIALAAGMVAYMLATMAGIKFAGGGLVPGGGAGVEDRTPILASGGEYVMPRTAVNQYGVGFMDAVRAGALNVNAPSSFNLALTVNGVGGLTEREIEEELAPALERLAARRRTRLVIS